MAPPSKIQFAEIFLLFLFTSPLIAEDTFQKDIKKLSIFQDAFDEMYGEMEELKYNATRHKTGHFSNFENDKIENLLFRYLVLRSSVWDIINKYRDYNSFSVDSLKNMKALLVGYCSALTIYEYSGLMVTKNMKDDQVVEKLNEAYFRSGIPRGSFEDIYNSLTKLENLNELDIANELISEELKDPNSLLTHLKKDSTFLPLILGLDESYDIHKDLRNQILNHFVLISPNITNLLRHSSIKKKVDDLIQKTGGRFEALRSIIFTQVSDIKIPGTKTIAFNEVDKKRLLNMLEPGDIILSYSEGYMSNLFLPGIFKHGMVFVGKRHEWDQEIWSKIKLTDKQKTLVKPKHDLIEAIAEGVVSSALADILDSKINRLAVFRPNLSQKEIVDAMQTVHSYIGNKYDFTFDFNDAESQVCTEVIYRGFNGRGKINFNLIKRVGALNLSAEDVCNYALESGTMKLITLIVEDKYRNGKPRFVKSGEALEIIKSLKD